MGHDFKQPLREQGREAGWTVDKGAVNEQATAGGDWGPVPVGPLGGTEHTSELSHEGQGSRGV